MTDFYEPADDPNSPLLQPIKPDILPKESPPPFSSETTPSSYADETELEDTSNRRQRNHRRRVRPSQGDTVLLSQLAPNHPDIAQRAGEEALSPASPSDTQSMKEDILHAGLGAAEQDGEFGLAKRALHAASAESKLDGPPRPRTENLIADFSFQREQCTSHAARLEANSNLRRLQPAPIRTDSTGEQAPADETLASSPNLAKYTITPSKPIASTLPALQTSPNRQGSVNPPEMSQSLPSLKTALGVQLEHTALPPISATSPSMPRPPAPPYFPAPAPSPSSYSHSSPASSKDHPIMSPPSTTLSTNPSFWRTGTKSETSMSSTISDSTTPSTLSHSPSNTHTSPSIESRGLGDNENAAMMSGIIGSGPFASSTFKCTYPGCNAAPFQTQYLLNSHANVHSQNRPHYCPVKGCPRGMGGKGFKRKNEMIRHGLVHDSPGYVCPFCPDQQHKYPRPDNLQRCD